MGRKRYVRNAGFFFAGVAKLTLSGMGGNQPRRCMSNDMMVYCGPREAYSVEVTVMEMLCASPCLTTMICFSLEQKLRGDRALDQDASMDESAAHGCARERDDISLAWEDLLQQLQDLGKKSLQNGPGPKLPHCGAKLREVVVAWERHAGGFEVRGRANGRLERP